MLNKKITEKDKRLISSIKDIVYFASVATLAVTSNYIIGLLVMIPVVFIVAVYLGKCDTQYKSKASGRKQ